MRKIEQRMVNAINNRVNYRESNTEVIVKGANVSLISTTSDGKLSIDDLKNKLNDNCILLALSLVESEVGTIQDYQEVQKNLEGKECKLLLDATRGIGKIPVLQLLQLPGTKQLQKVKFFSYFNILIVNNLKSGSCQVKSKSYPSSLLSPQR